MLFDNESFLLQVSDETHYCKSASGVYLSVSSSCWVTVSSWSVTFVLFCLGRSLFWLRFTGLSFCP